MTLRYISKRIVLMIVTFLVLIFIVFCLMKLLPIPNEKPFGMTEEFWQLILDREGLNDPILTQFGKWVKNILSNGNFGYSLKQNREVAKVIGSAIPVTVKLNIIPFLIAIPLGITLGIIAALRKDKFSDNLISFFVMIFISVPTFVVAVLLQYLIVYKWNWIGDAFVLSSAQAALEPVRAFKAYILPSVVIILGMIPGWTRGLRAELTEVLTSDFMLLAKSKGLNKRQVTIRHALRNAFVPFAPSIIGALVGLLGGSMIIEQTFGITGVGRLFITAFSSRDVPLLMIVLMFNMSIGLVAGLLGDISYSIIDPRIKVGATKSEQ